MNLSGVVNSIQKLAVRNSPQILIGLGVASLATCIGLAVRAAPKSTEVWVAKEYIIDEEVFYYVDDHAILREEFGTLEYTKILIKDFAPIWGPVAIAGIAAVSFFIGANHIQVKRQAMLAAAYSLSEKALTTYQKKVIENVGEKKHLEVMDSISEDELKRNPYRDESTIITTYGDTRFYDEWSGRYFLSDINAVRKAENEICKRLPIDMYCSVNDFYEQLNLPTIPSGAMVGWDVNDILLDVNYSPIFDSEGHPCTSISFLVGVLESKYAIL